MSRDRASAEVKVQSSNGSRAQRQALIMALSNIYRRTGKCRSDKTQKRFWASVNLCYQAPLDFDAGYTVLPLSVRLNACN